MKLSANMLNFLGYMKERLEHAPYDMVPDNIATGLAYPLGIKAAVENKLIVLSVHTLEPGSSGRRCPGVPYGSTFSGYRLTEKGEKVAEFGVAMRALKVGHANLSKDQRSLALIKQAQDRLNSLS